MHVKEESGVFCNCTNNAQAPSLFSNVTLTSRQSYVETVSGNSALLQSNGTMYKKLQTCLPTSRRPAKPYLQEEYCFNVYVRQPAQKQFRSELFAIRLACLPLMWRVTVYSLCVEGGCNKKLILSHSPKAFVNSFIQTQCRNIAFMHDQTFHFICWICWWKRIG